MNARPPLCCAVLHLGVNFKLVDPAMRATPSTPGRLRVWAANVEAPCGGQTSAQPAPHRHCLLLSRMALQSSDQDCNRLWGGLVVMCLLWQAVNRMCSHAGLGSTPDWEKAQ